MNIFRNVSFRIMKKYTLLIILLLGQLAIHAQEIELDTIWIKRYDWKYKNGVTHGLVLQFIYPTSEDSIIKTIREDITQKFFETDSILPFEEAQRHFKQIIYDDIVGESPDIYSYRAYDEKYSAVKISNDKVFNYIIRYDGSHGGVHGWSMFYYYCYDLLSGEEITISTLFSKEAQKKIIDMLISRPDDYQYLRNDKFGEVKRNIESLDNFLLLPQGIQFTYNTSEIGCTADGSFRYTVKYSEIKHLIKSSAQKYFYK